MEPISAFATALTSLTALKDIANGLVSVRDETKLAEAKIGLLNEVISLQQTVLTLQQEVSTLAERERSAQEEARRLREDANERASYALHEIRAGAFVYAHQAPDGGLNPNPHYLCQACYDKGVKAVLRAERPRTGLDGKLVCPENAAHTINTGGALPIRSISVTRG